MEAEYFPPREDVILQSEASTDLYVLVSGTVVSIIWKSSIISQFHEIPSTDINLHWELFLAAELDVLCRWMQSGKNSEDSLKIGLST